MSARELHVDLSEYQAEMRRILPPMGPHKSEALKKLRLQNMAAVEKAAALRQRPTRVS